MQMACPSGAGTSTGMPADMGVRPAAATARRTLDDLLLGLKTGPRGGHREGMLESAAKSAARAVGCTVGYPSPELVRAYGMILNSRGTAPPYPASLSGGEWDQPYITVVIDFANVYVAARHTGAA